MTRHPPTPDCDCDFCFAHDLNAVLRAFAERRERRDEETEHLAGATAALGDELASALRRA